MLKADGRSCQDRCARNRRHGRVTWIFQTGFPGTGVAGFSIDSDRFSCILKLISKKYVFSLNGLERHAIPPVEPDFRQ